MPIENLWRRLASGRRLAKVEAIKEYRGMLWGQKIKVSADHQNLMRDALGLNSDRVYC
jgi:hypothetical protein